MPKTSQAQPAPPSYRYLFGPVASSRLGRSLGLDLLGGPICSFDCVYCEVGRTKLHTCQRRAHVPASRLVQELRQWFKEGHQPPDYITLGGQGEPTLNSELGTLVHQVRQQWPTIPIAVLTNSSLLHREDVQEELAEVDTVLPSLDTLVDTEFHHLNRPCTGVDLSRISQGLLEFRRRYSGKIFLEILLVHGINDTAENKNRLREFIAEFSPQRVDVVTMTRPGAFSEARPIPNSILRSWREALGACQDPVARSSAPETHTTSPVHLDGQAIAATITNSLARRPQTVDQLAFALNFARSDVAATLDALQNQGTVVVLTGTDVPYYGLASSERN
ncbi:radical SAM protein [Desulfohalobium retbaense]|uniref:Radical SAM domain protein n=1 Tax=Desulfohalobium retbaense (strain ATCC 49708 / DSM 5692 / JCM 16813 / HR100) TaxID=485915 RepID=C8X0D0_DESRD|nr:radical SAM protein [Desulfohalobium retbaense]ACV67755.1 Radical SAM domain protein [Desulfohalobium retbaense DSM 5692]